AQQPVLAMPSELAPNLVLSVKSVNEPPVVVLRGAQVTAVKPTGEEVAIAEFLELPPLQTTSLLKPDVVKSLPKTASLLPLVGLIGCLALGMNMVLWVMRKRSARVIVPAHRMAPGATVDR